ncbi:MAG: hypothetical protein IJX16_01965 [Clostridia bacterium]|nr:hypothetical protein [Clostridia bacterium]
MKKFRFKYSTSVWVLLMLVVVLSTAGMVWNIFNLKEYVWAGAFKITVYALIVAITAFLSVFAISIMVHGLYVIKKDCLYTQFGFVGSKVKISEITEITHFKKSNKLVAYFKDEKYTVIVIDEQNYDEFVKYLREINKEIKYSVKIDGEDTGI